MREMHNVAESKFGGSRFKQLKNLHHLPARHTRLYLESVHKKRNPVEYALLMRRLAGMSSVTLNCAHIEPHLLLLDVQCKGDVTAEKQFLSMIKRLKLPSNTDIMPVIDVSGSMTGTPMDVAKALGLTVAYAQGFVKEAAYKHLFLTFDDIPTL